MYYGPAVILRFKGQTSKVGRQNQGLWPFPSRTVCGFFNVPQNYLQISVVRRSLRRGSGVRLTVGGGRARFWYGHGTVRGGMRGFRENNTVGKTCGRGGG